MNNYKDCPICQGWPCEHELLKEKWADEKPIKDGFSVPRWLAALIISIVVIFFL